MSHTPSFSGISDAKDGARRRQQQRRYQMPTTTLQALCLQEESHYAVSGEYLSTEKRRKCRQAMATWMTTVVDYLDFTRETVAIALNCLDRFLMTAVAIELQCLSAPRSFKIAGMTCLYTAIKAHEPEAVEPDLVVELSGHLCEVEDVELFEREILAALEWRINPPTPLAFCRQLLGVVPSCVLKADEKETLLDLAQVQTELAFADSRLVEAPPSLMALGCIFNALESQSKRQCSKGDNSKHLETLDDLSQLFFVALSSSQNLNMDDVFDIQDILDDIIRKHNQETLDEDNSDDPLSSDRGTQANGEQHDEDQDGDESSQSSTSTPTKSKPSSSPCQVSPTTVVEVSDKAAAEAA